MTFSNTGMDIFQSYLLGRDVNKATVSLADKVRVHDSGQVGRSVFEFLHLSPIKVIAVKGSSI